MAIPIESISSDDVGMPDLNGTAGSLVAVVDAIAPIIGWSTLFTDTNKRVYQLPPGTSQRCLRIHDDGSYDSGKSALVDAYATMSDIDTGSDQFIASNSYWTKSQQATATVRAWRAFSDGEFLHFFPRWQNVPTGCDIFQFGDIAKLHDSPPGPITLFNAAYNLNPTFPGQYSGGIYAPAASNRKVIFPDADGTGPAVQYANHTPAAGSQSYVGGSSNYSDPMDNGLDYALAPATISGCFGGSTNAYWIAGNIPGLYFSLNRTNTGLVDGDLIVDPPGLEGKTLMAIELSQANSTCFMFVDLTGPWR